MSSESVEGTFVAVGMALEVNLKRLVEIWRRKDSAGAQKGETEEYYKL